jgi:hypothetical protein
MRIPILLAMLLVTGATAAAQRPEVPAGWVVRLEPGSRVSDSTFSFVTMAPGWHITSGPAAMLHDPAQTATGEYTVNAEIFLFPGESASGYGVFLGGRDLGEDTLTHLSLQLRRDGHFMVEKRVAGRRSELVPWTSHPSVTRGAETPVKNVISVVVATGLVRFLVNGTEVTSLPRSGIVTDGIAGLVVGASLNLHVTDIAIVAESSAFDVELPDSSPHIRHERLQVSVGPRP